MASTKDLLSMASSFEDHYTSTMDTFHSPTQTVSIRRQKSSVCSAHWDVQEIFRAKTTAIHSEDAISMYPEDEDRPLQPPGLWKESNEPQPLKQPVQPNQVSQSPPTSTQPFSSRLYDIFWALNTKQSEDTALLDSNLQHRASPATPQTHPGTLHATSHTVPIDLVNQTHRTGTGQTAARRQPDPPGLPRWLHGVFWAHDNAPALTRHVQKDKTRLATLENGSVGGSVNAAGGGGGGGGAQRRTVTEKALASSRSACDDSTDAAPTDPQPVTRASSAPETARAAAVAAAKPPVTKEEREKEERRRRNCRLWAAFEVCFDRQMFGYPLKSREEIVKKCYEG